MSIFSRMIDKHHREAEASEWTDYVTCKVCSTTTVGNPANGFCFRCHDDPRRLCGYITGLEQEVERLREALEEYACENRWFTEADQAVSGSSDRCIYGLRGDGYRLAKEALEGE